MRTWGRWGRKKRKRKKRHETPWMCHWETLPAPYWGVHGATIGVATWTGALTVSAAELMTTTHALKKTRLITMTMDDEK